MKPIFKITADNKNITTLIKKYLTSLTLTDEAGSTADKLALQLDDRDGALVLPRKGVELACFLGYQEKKLTAKGKFIVDEVSLSGPPDKIDITAKSANLRNSLKVKKDKSFHAQSLGAIIDYIAGQHGLQAKISADLAAEQIEHIDQTNESDISFLNRLAGERDAIVKPSGEFLLFLNEADQKTASGKELPAVDLDKKDLTSWKITLSDRGVYNTVKAYYQDKGAAEKKEVTAGSGEEPVYTIRSTYPDKATAEKRAAARRVKYSRLGNALTITLPGRAEICVKTPINISGLKKGLNGAWIVKKATHKFTPGGYSLTLELQPKK